MGGGASRRASIRGTDGTSAGHELIVARIELGQHVASTGERDHSAVETAEETLEHRLTEIVRGDGDRGHVERREHRAP